MSYHDRSELRWVLMGIIIGFICGGGLGIYLKSFWSFLGLSALGIVIGCIIPLKILDFLDKHGW